MADDIIYVNVEEGSKRVMNNLKLYVKLLNKFKEDQCFDQINDALDKGEVENAQSSVHTLKGLAANLSLTELYKQSIELEAQIKNGNMNPDTLTVFRDAYSQTLVEADKVIAQYA
jgi:HPt (histidine-containing phosphotransfer) domain-containing protein